VALRLEDEPPGGCLVLLQPAYGPPGQQARETGHILLTVAPVDAQRVQLEDLACEVLVEPFRTPVAGLGVRPDGLRLIEIDQHRRMLLDGLQHVGEAAEHMRPDRLALEAARNPPHLALGDRDREMVRPEHHQPLDQRLGRRAGMREAGCRVLEEGVATDPSRPLRSRWLSHRGLWRRCGIVWPGRLAVRLELPLRRQCLACGDDDLMGRRQARPGDRCSNGHRELGRQIAPRIARDARDIARPRSEPEAAQCDG